MKKLILLFLWLTVAGAQWSIDPASPLQLGTGIMPRVAPAPDGGLYIAWLSENTFHVYLQRLDENGIPQWTQGGILVSDQQVDSWIAVFHLNLAVDSEGNAIITTVDMRTGAWEIYAYKISPDGAQVWGVDGLSLSANGGTNIGPRLAVIPGDNSIIVTWMENYSSLRLQRIEPAGTVLWGDGGMEVSDPNASLLSPQPVISHDGQILVQYIRQTGNFPAIQSQVMVRKYALDGTAAWPAVAMNSPAGFPLGNWAQDCLEDGQGGAYSSWTELTGNNQSGLVQRVDGSGAPVWSDPVEVSLASNDFRVSPRLAVTEGSHETYAVWYQSDANQVNRGIYGQYIRSDGTRGWGDTGIPIEPLGGQVFYDLQVAIAREDLTVSYIRETGGGSRDVLAARFDVDGNSVWGGGLIAVTNSGAEKTDLTMARGSGCSFLAWSENGSIRAHRLRDDGTLGPPQSHAPGILFVPLEYATIQEAIDAAVDNDTILVQPGVYVENLDLSGKEIMLASLMLVSHDSSYVGQTIIDGHQQGSVIVIAGGEGPATTIYGFTLRNGNGTLADPDGDGNYAVYGGAIYCDHTSPQLMYLKIMNNSVTNGGGGGLFGSASAAALTEVTFINNVSEDVGGAIYVRSNSDLTLNNCRFIGNQCADVGGALYARDSSDVSLNRVVAYGNISAHAGAGFGFKNGCRPIFTSVTITDNQAAHFGGSLYSNSSFLRVVNSLLWNNGGGEVYFSDFDDSSKILLAYTDIMSGIDGVTTNDNGEIIWSDGNLDGDPRFADTLHSNYALTLNSPAVDAGTAWFAIDGDTLVDLLPEEYLGGAPDMGALEFTPDTVNYFPLSVGKTWIYASDEDSFSVSVVDSLMIAGGNYYQLDRWYPGEDFTLFGNRGNQVFVRTDTSEFLLYDFAASIGEDWSVPGPDGSLSTVALIGIDTTVETPSGTFESCDVFDRIIGADYAYTEWFAPEIGLVQRDVITFAGTRRYQLVYTGPVLSVDEGNITPAEVYRLERNYPNPFNPVTTIEYQLPSSSEVMLTVFDVLGRNVITLVDGMKTPGLHSVNWDGRNASGVPVSTGLYFYQLKAGPYREIRKMLLLK